MKPSVFLFVLFTVFVMSFRTQAQQSNPTPKHKFELFPYGVLGQKGNAALVDTLGSSINGLRKSIFDFLGDSVDIAAKKSTMAIINGAIESLSDSGSEKKLNNLLDQLISHSVGNLHIELIAFKNELLDSTFRKQLHETLKSFMNDIVVNPTTELFNTAISTNTRNHIDNLLRMVIPATLNDSALSQIKQLREALLGDGAKKDISGLVDTALGTLNYRLVHDLGPNLKKSVTDTAKTLSDTAKALIIFAIVAIFIAVLIYHFLTVKKKNDMLFTVANSIEQFRKHDGTHSGENFHKLTDAIRANMVAMQLEGDMKKFLIKKNINKPSDYA